MIRVIGPDRGTTDDGAIGADFSELFHWMMINKYLSYDIQVHVAPYGIDQSRADRMTDMGLDMLNMFLV